MSPRPQHGETAESSASVGRDPREPTPHPRVVPRNHRSFPMKGIVAYALGVPLVVIVLLYLTDIF